MDIGKIGVWFFLDAMTAPESVEFARTVEKLGYGALWIPEAVGREPFAHSAFLAARTEKVVFATGIANIWARDPITMSAASQTVAEISAAVFSSASESAISRWSSICAAIVTTSPTVT